MPFLLFSSSYPVLTVFNGAISISRIWSPPPPPPPSALVGSTSKLKKSLLLYTRCQNLNSLIVFHSKFFHLFQTFVVNIPNFNQAVEVFLTFLWEIHETCCYGDELNQSSLPQLSGMWNCASAVTSRLFNCFSVTLKSFPNNLCWCGSQKAPVSTSLLWCCHSSSQLLI